MKERPILFSGPMVRAILEGRKTQTRRVVKPQPKLPGIISIDVNHGGFADVNDKNFPCKFGNRGDRLWVRETYADEAGGTRKYLGPHLYYKADLNQPLIDTQGGGWIPSIYMPRWSSRINLEITGVRVERLQGINSQDSFAEGIVNLSDGDYFEFGIRGLCSAQHPVRAYQLLWESINGAGSWDVNPWVWVLEFKPC